MQQREAIGVLRVRPDRAVGVDQEYETKEHALNVRPDLSRVWARLEWSGSGLVADKTNGPKDACPGVLFRDAQQSEGLARAPRRDPQLLCQNCNSRQLPIGKPPDLHKD